MSIMMLLAAVGLFVQSTDSLQYQNIADAEIRAAAHVSSHEIPQNQMVTYSLKVSWKGNLDRFEILKLEPPVLTNLRIVSSSSSNWVGQKDGQTLAVKTFETLLQPEEMGMAYIDGGIVEYKDVFLGGTQHLTTNRVEVKVVEPVFAKDWSGLLLAGSLVLLLLVAVFFAIGFVRRKKVKEAELREKAASEIPLEDMFLDSLKKDVDLQGHDIGVAFSNLSSVLRKYLSQKFGLEALGLTTSHLADELSRKGVDAKIVELAEEVLRDSDVVKFSGGQADRASLERGYTLVEQILENNRASTLNAVPQTET